MGGEGREASSADSLSCSWIGSRILATAIKSMSGVSISSPFRLWVVGVGLGTVGAPEAEYCEPKEVTLVTDIAAVGIRVNSYH